MLLSPTAAFWIYADVMEMRLNASVLRVSFNSLQLGCQTLKAKSTLNGLYINI